MLLVKPHSMKHFARPLGLSAFLLAAASAPQVALAQRGADDLISYIGGLVSDATPIVAGLALLVFFWGLVKFIYAAGNEEKRKAGKQVMLWGLIALFVMLALWGILRFLSRSILDSGLGGNDPNVPQVGNLPGPG